MRSSASTYITAQFISSILAARPTPLAELADTVAVVAATVSRLLAPTVTISRAEPAEIAPARRPGRPRLVKPLEIESAARAEIAEPAAKPVRRGRPPRRQIVDAEVADLTIPEAEAPVSRLLRRSTVATAPVAAADPFEKERSGESRVKGVVKWFDTRSSKGVLRLAGMADDIALDTDLLAKSRVKRLYKDQEIEVIGEYLDGRFHLKSLSVPGQSQETLVTNGQVVHSAGRQSRAVFVEVKRAHPRLQSARAEAEHAFGRAGSGKPGL